MGLHRQHLRRPSSSGWSRLEDSRLWPWPEMHSLSRPTRQRPPVRRCYHRLFTNQISCLYQHLHDTCESFVLTTSSLISSTSSYVASFCSISTSEEWEHNTIISFLPLFPFPLSSICASSFLSSELTEILLLESVTCILGLDIGCSSAYFCPLLSFTSVAWLPPPKSPSISQVFSCCAR